MRSSVSTRAARAQEGRSPTEKPSFMLTHSIVGPSFKILYTNK
jgi:hypothetical protein